MFKRNSIFQKFVLVVISSTLIVSVIITIAATKISERILLDQTIQNSTVNLQLVKDDLLTYNEQIVNTMIQINASDEFKQYLTKPYTTNLERLNIVIRLGKYMDTYKSYLSPDQTHFIISGIGKNEDRNYSSNALKWDKIPPNLVNDYMTENGLVSGKMMYHSSEHLFSAAAPYKQSIFATKPLLDRNSMYGFAVVIMDEETMFQRYDSYLTVGSHISLVKSDGHVLSSSKRELLGTTQDQMIKHARIADNDQFYGLKTQQGHTFISLFIPEYDAYLLQEINQKEAFVALNKISYQITSIVIVLCVVMMIITYLITKKITKPLHRLVDTMQSAKADALVPHPLHEKTSYEINVVTKTYNHLIKEIDNYTKQIMYEQNERRKADLSALQMQINPHFLYNTLTSIKYLAKMNRIDDVDRTITSLSGMLQHTIGTTEDVSSISEVIENLQHYVFINHIRYGDQVQVHFDVQKQCEQLMIPKLIIQPFVENAFFHAFPGDRKGNIYIFVRLQAEHLLIEVLDDGVGAKVAAQNKRKRAGTGIGIENVHHRIKLLYGVEYGVTINSSEQYGTAVKITLPINENNSIIDS